MQLFNTDNNQASLIHRALVEAWRTELLGREHRLTGKQKYRHNPVHEFLRVSKEQRAYNHGYYHIYHDFMYDARDYDILIKSAYDARQVRDLGGCETAGYEFDLIANAFGNVDVVRRFKYHYKRTNHIPQTVERILKSTIQLLYDHGDCEEFEYNGYYDKALTAWATYMLFGKVIAPYTITFKEVVYYLMCHRYRNSRALKFCLDSYSRCNKVDNERVSIIDYVQYVDHPGIISRRNIIQRLVKTGYAKKIRHRILRRAHYLDRYEDLLEHHNYLVKKFKAYKYADKQFIPVLSALDAHLTQYELLFHRKAHAGNVFNALMHYHNLYRPSGKCVSALDDSTAEQLIANNSFYIKDWQNEKEWLLQCVKKQRLPKINKHHKRVTIPIGVLMTVGQINHFITWMMLRRQYTHGAFTFKTMMLYFHHTCGMTQSAARSCAATFVKSPYVAKEGSRYRLRSQHALCDAKFIQTIAVEHVFSDYKTDRTFLRRAIISGCLSFPLKSRPEKTVLAKQIGVSANTMYQFNDCRYVSWRGTTNWSDLKEGIHYIKPDYVKAYWYTRNLKHGSSRDDAQSGACSPRVRINPRRTVITVQEKPGFKVLLYTSVNRTKRQKDVEMTKTRSVYADLPSQRKNL